MLDSAVIEVRQHLCCANIFLKFKHPFTDLESLKIIVDETKIKLQTSTCSAELLVNKSFAILAGTFSNLIVAATNASFRISIKDIQISKKYENDKRNCGHINLDEHDVASVMCSNCNSILAIQQKYNKIREFPSGAIDVSEFFCHHGPNFQDILVPSISDLFYGFLFIVVNRDVIKTSTRLKEDHIYCERCLRYLGETICNGRAVKLWCDSIRFNIKGELVEIFAKDDKSQIHNLILKVIEETSLPAPEPLLRNMHFTKVLLRASFPNRQQQYLLVHILEKHVPVLINKECIQSDVDLKEYQTTYEFKQHKAFKILYRLIAKADDNNHKEATSWPPILEYWQKDIKILKMNISPFLFSGLHKELDENVAILPEIYRVNNDDFLLSYIFY